MRRPGAVCFHAALRTTHDARRLSDVQFLPVTHQESLALTYRQTLELLLNDFKHLTLLQFGARRRLDVRAVPRLVGLQRVLLVVLAAAGRERGEERRPQRAHLLAPVIVADRVLRAGGEEKRPFPRGGA